MKTMQTQALTLRIDSELHDAVARLARKQDASINSYLNRQLREMVRLEEEKARYDAYTLLGQEAEADDDYARHAQAEVMLNDRE